MASTHSRTLAELDAQLPRILAAPRDGGAIALLVRRPAMGERETPDVVRLEPAEGLVGDDWCRRPSSKTPDGSPHPDRQLTLMGRRVLSAIEPDAARWPLAGDQIVADLDLSDEHLPAGTRLAVGAAIVVATAQAHTGCSKFAARYGADALRFVATPRALALRLRGAYLRVERPGEVRVGDSIVRCAPPPREVRLRPVRDDDLPTFFTQQADPVSTRLAGVPARDRPAFDAHWARIRTEPTTTLRTLEVDGRVAGQVLRFPQGDRLLVGYWLARAYWGQGLAGRALELMLAEEPRRPLFAHVALHNVASRRVLERQGFSVCAQGTAPDGADGGPVAEQVLRLD